MTGDKVSNASSKSTLWKFGPPGLQKSKSFTSHESHPFKSITEQQREEAIPVKWLTRKESELLAQFLVKKHLLPKLPNTRI